MERKSKITCADVKQIREDLDLTERELAEELECTVQAVYSWERELPGSKRRIHPIFANQLRKLKEEANDES